MHSMTENSNNEKFSVEKLLENCSSNRKEKISEDQDHLETDQIETLNSIKRPNLKFGIDSILKEKDALFKKPTNKYDNFPRVNSNLLIPASGPTQSEYYFSRNSAPICYDSQCITFSKPLQDYQYFYYNSIASNNPIPTNNIGDGNYSSIQGNYNYGSYYNHSGVRVGEHTTSQPSAKGKKAKWNRAVFTNLQRKGLEKRFSIQKYITKPDRRKLADMLRLSDSQVKVWFQNRRMKWRHSREYKEELSKTATNKEQQLITNFPVNKTEEIEQN